MVYHALQNPASHDAHSWHANHAERKQELVSCKWCSEQVATSRRGLESPCIDWEVVYVVFEIVREYEGITTATT